MEKTRESLIQEWGGREIQKGEGESKSEDVENVIRNPTLNYLHKDTQNTW